MNTYTVTIGYPGGHFDVASESVTVLRDPASIIDPAGMCVDVSGGNSANGTPVQLWTCDGLAAQQWTTPGDGTVRALGKCLDVAGGATNSGTRVQLWDCNGSGAQLWATNNSALANPQSGLCLDATGGSTAPGTPLQIWDCTGNTAQQWDLPDGSSLPVYDANAGTVTFTLQPSVGQGPIIHCSIRVDNPKVTRFDTLYVSADGITACDLPVSRIEMSHTLFVNGLPVAQDNQVTPVANAILLTTHPDIICIAGLWSSAASATIIPPLGYAPQGSIIPIAVIFSTNNTRVPISINQCLADVVGMSDSAARSVIAQHSLRVGTVTHKFSNAPIDSVTSFSVQADGVTVDIVESDGTTRVPNILGLPEADARAKIEGYDLKVGRVSYDDRCFSPGDVQLQSPPADTRALDGDAVNFTVSTCGPGQLPK